jgi:hypothetical protein
MLVTEKNKKKTKETENSPLALPDPVASFATDPRQLAFWLAILLAAKYLNRTQTD